ncbi:MAG: hypothetical protein V3V31_08190 [Methylococcales bacterium]
MSSTSMYQKYKKKQGQIIVAVPLTLDTEGFMYNKWGGEQRCKQGDWIVENNGEVYTIDRDVFARTYSKISPGIYEKSTVVWAEIAQTDGAVATKEGESTYKKRDYIVSNDEIRTDEYCISKAKFEAMYELDEN